MSQAFKVDQPWKISLPVIVTLLMLSACSSSSNNGSSEDPQADDMPLDDMTDNCPGIDNPDQLDTDGDGLGDACDQDDDGDGFADVDDPAPLDSTRPGDFATPESILDNPLVDTAIAAAEADGWVIRTETGLTPPEIAGYYNRADFAGEFIATSSGTDIGRGLIGVERRVEQDADNLVNIASVGYTAGSPVAFSLGEGSIIRGQDSQFTVYSRTKTTCTRAGSNFSNFRVNITSAELNAESGDIEEVRELSVTVDVEGELTSSCANLLAGSGEVVGEWVMTEFALDERVEPTSLIYMCVDDDAAYAPTEQWTGSDGLACECTDEYQISCQ